jgi:hypothetical protein
MSYITYNQYTRLTDSMERQQMREALSCGEPFSFFEEVKRVYSASKKAIIATLDFIVEVNQLMADAREKALRLGDSQW